MSGSPTVVGESPALVRRYRLADQAYEVIRNWILERRLVPGDRLSVPQLAEELGLSRSPVREAVQRLVTEGLGVERVNHGAVVTSIRVDEIDTLYAVREVLEGLSARLATVARDDQLVADLEQLVADHAAAIDAGDEAAVIVADLRFHARILEATDNQHLELALRPILGRVNIAMLAGDLRAWPSGAVLEHRRILRAIVAADPDAADARAREHVALVRDRLRTRLRDD